MLLPYLPVQPPLARPQQCPLRENWTATPQTHCWREARAAARGAASLMGWGLRRCSDPWGDTVPT
eukprot:scaffold143824_cov90-Phaeocystis_antarctica.AAC.1